MYEDETGAGEPVQEDVEQDEVDETLSDPDAPDLEDEPLDFDPVKETLEILGDPETLAAIEEGVADIEAGRVVHLDETAPASPSSREDLAAARVDSTYQQPVKYHYTYSGPDVCVLDGPFRADADISIALKDGEFFDFLPA